MFVLMSIFFVFAAQKGEIRILKRRNSQNYVRSYDEIRVMEGNPFYDGSNNQVMKKSVKKVICV